MSLKDRLVADMTQAMKNKNANRLSTLRMAKSALMNEENKRGVGTVLTDEEVTKVLQSLVKQRKDSIAQYETAGRTELAEKEKAELAVLEEYLPQAASPEEIAAAINRLIAEPRERAEYQRAGVAVASHFDISRWRNQWNNLLHELQWLA